MDRVTTDDIARFAAWVDGFEGFETGRLSTRRLRVDDADALFEAMRSPRVNKWISGFAQPFDLSAARRWLVPRIERMERGEGVYGAVFYRHTNTMLGFMHAVMEPELGGVEIAGALHEIYWGKGFVEEFSSALLDNVFAAGTPVAVATCALDNWSSFRALHAMNFERQGQVEIATPQGPRPSWLYSLTPAQWEERRFAPLHDGLGTDEVRERRKALIEFCREMKAARLTSRLGA